MHTTHLSNKEAKQSLQIDILIGHFHENMFHYYGSLETAQ
jgi:hypothetical protein